MPLVSGVCRTASAPMLSHGGSRLNASKPEANPKTRYPTKRQQNTQIDLSHPPVDKRNSFLFVSGASTHKHTRFDRIASQTIAACAASVAQSTSKNHKNSLTPRVPALSQTMRVDKHKNQNKDPLQTREHAWAGISGMLRFRPGLKRHSTSRGAKP